MSSNQEDINENNGNNTSSSISIGLPMLKGISSSEFKDDLQNKTFPTEVEVFSQGRKRDASVDTNMSMVSRRSSVLGPKDTEVKNTRQPLPKTVNLSNIIDTVLQEAPFTSKKSNKMFWWSQITSEEFENLLTDSFYWVLKYIIQDDSTNLEDVNVSNLHLVNKSPHFDRMAVSYVNLFQKIPKRQMDFFFRHFQDVLAFTLLLTFMNAFVEERTMFESDAFIEKLVDITTEWTTGLRVSARASDESASSYWLCRYFYDLQKATYTPNPFSTNAASQSFQQKEKERARKKKEQEHYSPVINVRTGYVFNNSPLMRRYMKLNGVEQPKTCRFKKSLTEEFSRPVRTILSKNISECSQTKIKRNVDVLKKNRIPDLGLFLKDTKTVRDKIYCDHLQNREEINSQIEEIRLGNFDFTSKYDTKEMESVLATKDRRELSNYVTMLHLDKKKSNRIKI